MKPRVFKHCGLWCISLAGRIEEAYKDWHKAIDAARTIYLRWVMEHRI